jgi:imidazolonepropionase-like amidohydrolase
MCFLHGDWAGSVTRGDALLQLGAFSALPVMPKLGHTPAVRPANQGREYTAIVGVTAFVGEELTARPNTTILLHRNRIEVVGPAAQVAIPAGAHRIDARGLFAIPGLIDSHVHFFQSGGLYTRPDAIDLRAVRPYTEEIAWIKANLHDTFARYLRAGITSVVDVGGPFWNYDVRAEANRTTLAPRVMVAGPLISSVERSILDPENDPPIVKIDTIEAARALIDRELAQHTDFVKFWWVLMPGRPAAAFQPIAQAATAYAHQRGARVVIHATELETARLAVASGADILAHSVFDAEIDDGFVELLQKNKTIYCPTLLVSGNYGYTFHGTPKLTSWDLRVANPNTIGTLLQMHDVETMLPPPLLERIRQLRVPEPPHVAMRNLKRIHQAGIRVAAGTDAGNIGTQHASSLYAEAVAMVESGLSPREVLLSATRGGAQMMGRSDVGALDAGKLGDVVLLREDPAKDIRAIAAIEHVIKDGLAYRTASILDESAEDIVQRQVNAYNMHDVAVFSETYAQDAKVVSDGKIVAVGRRQIADLYAGLFTRAPDVRATILEREVRGNRVTDRETVTRNGKATDASVVYTLASGLIAEAAVTSARS